MGLKNKDFETFKLMRAMMNDPLPPDAKRFDSVDDACAWILKATSPVNFTRVALVDDKAAMKHFVWHAKSYPGTNRQCTIQGVRAWIGAGPEVDRESAE